MRPAMPPSFDAVCLHGRRGSTARHDVEAEPLFVPRNHENQQFGFHMVSQDPSFAGHGLLDSSCYGQIEGPNGSTAISKISWWRLGTFVTCPLYLS